MPPVLWRSDELESLEFFTLRETEDGYELAGTVIAPLDGAPAKIEYAIRCGADWRTKSAAIRQTLGDAVTQADIAVDEAQNWTLNGQPVPALCGLFDLDLSVTPATNTLVMRRMNAAVGESFETSGAWLLFPDLTFAPLPQTYRRVSQTEYAYDSPTHGIAGRIAVDERQVVVTYLDLWRRV